MGSRNREKRTDAEFELVDIKDFNLPLLDEPMPPMMGQRPLSRDLQPYLAQATYRLKTLVTRISTN